MNKSNDLKDSEKILNFKKKYNMKHRYKGNLLVV
jgi:hypothetical protein